MSARGYRPIRPPTVDLDPVPRYRVELLGLGVMVAVLERMTAAERSRALEYINDRYGRPHGQTS